MQHLKRRLANMIPYNKTGMQQLDRNVQQVEPGWANIILDNMQQGNQGCDMKDRDAASEVGC